MSHVIALDLEMDQPSNNIIEIGYVIADRRGVIKLQRSILIKQDVVINPQVVELTGITDAMLKSGGVDKEEATRIMNEDLDKYSPSKMAITWGVGDVRLLLQQFPEIALNNRYLDVKALYQIECAANNDTMQSGLFKACNKLGISVHLLQAHRAHHDAEATYLVYMNYINKFRKIRAMEKIWDT